VNHLIHPGSAIANIGIATFWAGPPTLGALRDIVIAQQPGVIY
jgi:hypothetical protein